MRWYVVETGYREENLAVVSIADLGMTAFVPSYVGRKGGLLVLFPCYAFAKFGESDNWKALARCRGVKRILGPAEKPLPLPVGVAESFMTPMGLEETKKKVEFVIGGMARVGEGPMTGIVGTVTRVWTDRVLLLVSMFNRATEVILPNACVERV